MTDLHQRLTNVIEERLRVVREAVAALRVWGWNSDQDPAQWEALDTTVLVVNSGHIIAGGGEYPASVDAEIAEHVALHDPADAIRRYERDLAVLGRHRRAETRLPTGVVVTCDYCESLCHADSGLDCNPDDVRWPCAEIRDLAAVFGVSDDPA